MLALHDALPIFFRRVQYLLLAFGQFFLSVGQTVNPVLVTVPPDLIPKLLVGSVDCLVASAKDHRPFTFFVLIGRNPFNKIPFRIETGTMAIRSELYLRSEERRVGKEGVSKCRSRRRR